MYISAAAGKRKEGIGVLGGFQQLRSYHNKKEN